MYNVPETIIYLVDDDDGFREATAAILNFSGFNVKECSNAKDLFEALVPDDPGCIILDIQLPQLSGSSIQEILIQNECALPIIFISGRPSFNVAVKVMKKGAFDFLEKPVSGQALIASIEAAVSESRNNYRKNKAKNLFLKKYKTITKRENEVFGLMIAGKQSKEIAKELNISIKTIEVHRKNILLKFGVKNILELLKLVYQNS